MSKEKEAYQEGFEDGVKQTQKTHVCIDEITETFDKFFDKINDLKKLLKYYYTHHKESKNINNELMETEEQKNKNLSELISKTEIINKEK